MLVCDHHVTNFSILKHVLSSCFWVTRRVGKKKKTTCRTISNCHPTYSQDQEWMASIPFPHQTSLGLLTSGYLQGRMSSIPIADLYKRHLWSSETWQHQHKDQNINRTIAPSTCSPGCLWDRGDGTHTRFTPKHHCKSSIVTGQPEE